MGIRPANIALVPAVGTVLEEERTAEKRSLYPKAVRVPLLLVLLSLPRYFGFISLCLWLFWTSLPCTAGRRHPKEGGGGGRREKKERNVNQTQTEEVAAPSWQQNRVQHKECLGTRQRFFVPSFVIFSVHQKSLRSEKAAHRTQCLLGDGRGRR